MRDFVGLVAALGFSGLWWWKKPLETSSLYTAVVVWFQSRFNAFTCHALHNLSAREVVRCRNTATPISCCQLLDPQRYKSMAQFFGNWSNWWTVGIYIMTIYKIVYNDSIICFWISWMTTLWDLYIFIYVLCGCHEVMLFVVVSGSAFRHHAINCENAEVDRLKALHRTALVSVSKFWTTSEIIRDHHVFPM